jgi:hypothetical protein
MTLFAVTGKAQGLNAIEAAIQATDQALSLVGRHPVSLAFIVASPDFPVRDVVNGVSGLLSNTPLFGFSTPAQINGENIDQRSIVVALLAGDQVKAESNWWSDSDDGSQLNAEESIRPLCAKLTDLKGLFVALDVFNQDPESIIETIPEGPYCLGGCLAGGNFSSERSYQIGGSRFGQRGMAAIAIHGEIEVAISSKHGWQPVGIYSRITHASDNIIYTLDGRPAAEIYAQNFGYTSNDWAYPPLDHLVRLYPLGIEQDETTHPDNPAYTVYSPIMMKHDGSLQMNRRIAKDETTYFLVSSKKSCINTARTAAQQAMQALDGAKPVLALVLSDIAWQMMLPDQPGAEIQAVREVIGATVPIIGGYSYGQISFSTQGKPELLNQHLQLALFGDPI